MKVPSGSQSGLKINQSFTVAAGTADLNVGDDDTYTIDFDLRKSIVDPGGQPGYFLKPVLRLVQNIMTGSVAGKIDNAFLIDASCGVNAANAVYLYTGSSITADDIGSTTEPVATSLVELDAGSGEYRYELGYIEQGTYTIAFTCQAELDLEGDDVVVFQGETDIQVDADTVTIHDF